MSLEITALADRKTGDFYFKRLGRQILLTNELGEHVFLDPCSFRLFLNGERKKIPASKLEELLNKGFVRPSLNTDILSYRYALRNRFLFSGPSLHIIIVTLRCDHRCSYCQTSSRPEDSPGWDMDEKAAAKTVDIIFESPSADITIEFQGGEPLLNFGIIKFIINYARQKNKTAGKGLNFTLVSNFSYMDEEKLDFLIQNNVSLCTSLDGPERLHNRNRAIASGRKNSYRITIKWIKAIQKKIKSGEFKCGLNALATITRFSLPYPEQIVDEYVKLGFKGVHLRPVYPFGIHRSRISKALSCPSREFMIFYRRAMERILEINRQGVFFYERMARILLTKILSDNDQNYLDLRSPCGACIGQLAYNFNGDVYTCDEGRMISAGCNDEVFKLGNVMTCSYRELIDNPTVKALCFASCLSNLPRCSDCAYRPYCGVCPVYNYATEGNLFSRTTNDRCSIQRSQLDYLFTTLRTPARQVYEAWVGN